MCGRRPRQSTGIQWRGTRRVRASDTRPARATRPQTGRNVPADARGLGIERQARVVGGTTASTSGLGPRYHLQDSDRILRDQQMEGALNVIASSLLFVAEVRTLAGPKLDIGRKVNRSEPAGLVDLYTNDE